MAQRGRADSCAEAAPSAGTAGQQALGHTCARCCAPAPDARRSTASSPLGGGSPAPVPPPAICAGADPGSAGGCVGSTRTRRVDLVEGLGLLQEGRPLEAAPA